MRVEAGDPIAAPDGTWCLWTGGIPRLWGSSKSLILSNVSERVGSLDKAQALMGSGRKRWELLRERDPALVAALERKMAAAARAAAPVVADEQADEEEEREDEEADETAHVSEEEPEQADEQKEESAMSEQEERQDVASADHPAYQWISGQLQFAMALGISRDTLRKRLLEGMIEEREGTKTDPGKGGRTPNEYRIKLSSTVEDVIAGVRSPRVKKEASAPKASSDELASCRGQLDAACAEVTRQDALIEQMREELEAMRQERSIHWQAREEDTARLMQRDEEREAVESERAAQIEDLKAQIGERDGVISDLRAQLASAHLLLRGVASVKAVERERDHANELLHHARTEVETLRAELAALNSAPIPAPAPALAIPPTLNVVVGALKTWLGQEVVRLDVRLESGAVVGVTP